MAKNSRTAQVRQYLLENPNADTQETAEKFNVPKQIVYVVRSQLKKKGVIGGTKKKRRPRKVSRRSAIKTSRSPAKPSQDGQSGAAGVLERLASLAKAHSWQPLDDLAELVDSQGWEEVKKAFEVVKEVQRGLQ